MLRRANGLQEVFNQYCIDYNRLEFRLSPQEWRQVEYLLCITKPFYDLTVGLSKVKDTTIHSVFEAYNRLFAHFEDSMARLRRKRVLETSNARCSLTWTKQACEILQED